MSRVNENDSRSVGAYHAGGFKLGVCELVPANDYVLSAKMPPVVIMTPAGAVDVLMPASSAETKGLTFWIYNVGAGGIITLKTSTDAAFATAITVAVSGGWVMVVCTGSPTANLGWRVVASNLP